MLKMDVRVKIFIPLLENYCEHLIRNVFQNYSEYESMNILSLSENTSLKTEEQLIKSETIGSKERLMIVLGSIIYYKDFKKTQWMKEKFPKIIYFENKNEGSSIKGEEKKECLASPEMINVIFKVFSQKVSCPLFSIRKHLLSKNGNILNLFLRNFDKNFSKI